MVIQLSLMPDERPDEMVLETGKRPIYLRRAIRRILKKEGPYNFCMLAKEALSHDEAWIRDKYGVHKDYLAGILASEFGTRYANQETMDSFLEKVRMIPNYQLKEPDDVSPKRKK